MQAYLNKNVCSTIRQSCAVSQLAGFTSLSSGAFETFQNARSNPFEVLDGMLPSAWTEYLEEVGPFFAAQLLVQIEADYKFPKFPMVKVPLERMYVAQR